MKKQDRVALRETRSGGELSRAPRSRRHHARAGRRCALRRCVPAATIDDDDLGSGGAGARDGPGDLVGLVERRDHHRQLHGGSVAGAGFRERRAPAARRAAALTPPHALAYPSGVSADDPSGFAHPSSARRRRATPRPASTSITTKASSTTSRRSRAPRTARSCSRASADSPVCSRRPIATRSRSSSRARTASARSSGWPRRSDASTPSASIAWRWW